MTTTLQQRFEEKFRYGGCNDATYLAILAFIKQELEMMAVEVEEKREMQTALNQPGLVDGIRNSVLVEAAAIIRNRIKEVGV